MLLINDLGLGDFCPRDLRNLHITKEYSDDPDVPLAFRDLYFLKKIHSLSRNPEFVRKQDVLLFENVEFSANANQCFQVSKTVVNPGRSIQEVGDLTGELKVFQYRDRYTNNVVSTQHSLSDMEMRSEVK